MSVNEGFDFENLVELFRCEPTREAQHSAARAMSMDRSLVVRNWLFGLVYRRV